MTLTKKLRLVKKISHLEHLMMGTIVFSVIFSVFALLQQGNALHSKANADEGCVVTDFNKVSEAVSNCNNITLDSIQVPRGETLKLHLNDGSSVTFRGETVFGYALWEGPLVEINGTDVVIQGEKGAILNGQGKLYWDGQGQWGTLKPRFFVIQLHKSVMKNIHVLNAPMHCVRLADSVDVELSNWVIDNKAGDPEVAGTNKSGHNTDGFGVRNGTNITIRDSEVYNQDDCVALNWGNRILVDNMLCKGGHGLSLSVGFSNDSVLANTLTNVLISNSVLKGGRNGIHIKTHIDAGAGAITNVTYQNIVFSDMEFYGINIQGNYQDINSTQPDVAANNIPIRNLSFDNIFGSVGNTEAVPIYINCAVDGCFDWSFTDVVVKGNSSNNDCNFVPSNFSC